MDVADRFANIEYNFLWVFFCFFFFNALLGTAITLISLQTQSKEIQSKAVSVKIPVPCHGVMRRM